MAVKHTEQGNGMQPETSLDKRGKCTQCGGGNHKAEDCHHRNAKWNTQVSQDWTLVKCM